MPYVIGIDLGGTKLSAAVVSADGRLAPKLKFAIDKDRTVEQAAHAAEEAVRAAGVTWGEIAAVGVVVPGIYYAQTGNVWAPNLFGSEELPLGTELSPRLPAPVVLDSDRAAYVTGEHWLGAARGLSHVVFLGVGTGIGAGILIDGRICRGARDIAGAVGWFALDPQKQPAYREVGCWESHSAGPAIARRAAARLRSGVASILNAEGLTTEAVVDAARQGDPLAREVLDESARYLGMGIANIVSLLNPEMIVLGGGLMHAADLLLEPLRREMLDWAQPIAARHVRIALTELGEDAGLLGAARLALLQTHHHVG